MFAWGQIKEMGKGLLTPCIAILLFFSGLKKYIDLIIYANVIGNDVISKP